MKRFVIISFLVTLGWADDINSKYFPENLKFGVATAATQIEGAWDQDGKGESIWDHFSHMSPSIIIVDGSNPDVACDSYYKFKEDIALAKDLGVAHYRFSIAWSRILPTGYTDQVNEAGVDHYRNILKELRANGIEPLVTIFHWDLPQPLEEELGGWLSSEIADVYAEYARLCFELFGDEVKTWLTMNEPKQICNGGYGVGYMAPGVRSNGVGEYLCARNVLLAHAKAYHIYDEEYRAKQGGKVSLVIDTNWYEAATDEDLHAQDRTIQFNFGLYGHPVYKGNWPQVVIERVEERSKKEGYPKSRLPEFTKEEIDYINGTHDYFALNHYTTQMVNASADADIGQPSFDSDISVLLWDQPEWIGAQGSFIKIVPWGLRKLLNWIKTNYGDMEIVITENGLSDTTGEIEDDIRITYLQEYISSVLSAIYEDGINVSHYTVWTLMDDWEWIGGYEFKMGLYSIDFSSPNRTRTPKKSAEFYRTVLKNRCLTDSCKEELYR